MGLKRFVQVALLSVTFLAGCSSSQAPTLRIVKGPYLQNVKMDEITIMWETNLPATSRVDYGETEQYGLSAASGEPALMHEITVPRLSPQTTFHYRVVSEANGDRVQSPDGTFSTARLPSSPVTLCAYGDSRSDPSTHEAICQRMLAHDPDLVLHCGDMVSDGPSYSQWGSDHFGPARELMRLVPMFTVPGNHERQHDNYADFFSNPTESSATEWYYSFDYASAHFCMIDSCDSSYGHGNDLTYSPGSAQYEWIASDLSSTAKEWKIVVLHHPPYSSGPHGCHDIYRVRDDLVPLFTEHDVDLVIAGHDHLYERTVAIDGVVYVVSGGGGAPLYRKECENPWSAKVISAHHFCLITIDGGDLLLEVRDMNDEVIDTLHLTH